MRILFVVLVLVIACTPRHMDQSTDSKKPISEVLASRTPEWMKIPGVIGSGETKKDDQPAIMIFVDTMTDELRTKLPKQIDGYPVVIEQSGKVVPLR